MRHQESVAERFLLRVLALVLFATGALLLWMCWVAWSTLFGGYRDSAVITYVVMGVITLVLGTALVIGSWWTVRPRTRKRSP